MNSLEESRTDKMKALEESCAVQKKAQEESADKLESMQLQVQQLNARRGRQRCLDPLYRFLTSYVVASLHVPS